MLWALFSCQAGRFAATTHNCSAPNTLLSLYDIIWGEVLSSIPRHCSLPGLFLSVPLSAQCHCSPSDSLLSLHATVHSQAVHHQLHTMVHCQALYRQLSLSILCHCLKSYPFLSLHAVFRSQVFSVLLIPCYCSLPGLLLPVVHH